MLSACASTQPRKKPAPVSASTIETNTSYNKTAVVRNKDYKSKKILDTDSGSKRADKLIKTSETAPSDVQATLKMRAAELYIENNQSSKANEVVKTIRVTSLSKAQKNQYSVLKAKALVNAGQYQQALNELSDIKFNQFKQSRYQAEYLLNVSRAFIGTIDPSNSSGKLRKSANAMDALIKREAYLPDELSISQNSNELWKISDTLSKKELEKIYQSTSSEFLKSWLESTLLKRSPTVVTPQVPQANSQTQEQPLASTINIDTGLNTASSDMAQINNTSPEYYTQTIPEPVIQPSQVESSNSIASNWNDDSAKRIALLLPLSSKFANAARSFEDGFKTAHRNNNAQYKPQISVYNIDTAADIQTILGQAIAEGSDFIVGPLGKFSAQQVLDNGYSNVPILALGGAINSPSPNRSVFTLSPEQEAYAIAQNAIEKGYYRAAILTPSTAYGARIKAALANGLQTFGGSVVASAGYDPNQYDHSAVIKNLLSLESSATRHNSLSTLLGFRPKFTPSRRSDVDFLLLAGKPTAARVLKPQLSFYQAHNLPTYSTSSVFSGSINKVSDADLENIIFPEMPILLDQLISDSTQSISSSAKLQAFGNDAYNLVPIINDLKQYSGTSYLGLTGRLSINGRGEVIREPAWAKFKKGLPTRLNEGANYSNYGVNSGVVFDKNTAAGVQNQGSNEYSSSPTQALQTGGPSPATPNQPTVINRSNRYDSKTWNTRTNRRASSP